MPGTYCFDFVADARIGQDRPGADDLVLVDQHAPWQDAQRTVEHAHILVGHEVGDAASRISASMKEMSTASLVCTQLFAAKFAGRAAGVKFTHFGV